MNNKISMNIEKKLHKLWPTYLEGKLLVWPNVIMHGSYPYSSKKNRIIVSTNTTVSLVKNNRLVLSS